MRPAKVSGLGEATFVVVALIFFQGAFGPLLLLQNDVLTEDARASLRIINLPFYAMTCLLVAPRVRLGPAIKGIKANWHLALLLGLAWLSVVWSIAPDISLRRCVALSFTMLFGVYACARYDLASLLRLLAIACGVIIALSLAFIVLLPSMGLSPIDQTWRGVFPNKNTFGGNLLLATIVFANVEVRVGWQRLFRWVGMTTAVFALWFCRSRGPLLVLLAIAPAMLLMWTFRFRLQTRAMLGSLVLILTFVGAAAMYLFSDEVFDILARDPTLTGRTELWSLVATAVAERPLLGYGYGAFWEATTGLSATIWESIGWDAPNAHSGYMDLWLGVGLFGPVVLLVSLGINLRNAVLGLKNGHTFEARWCIVFIAALIASNLDESDFLEQNSILMILYVATTIYARRAILRRRARSTFVTPRHPFSSYPLTSDG